MVKHRLYGLISLLLLTAIAVGANPLTSRRLPDGRFRDWIALQVEFSATQINQVWRQPLSNLPKGADGYQMVSYQVQQCDSPQEASKNARAQLLKRRFNEYVAQGYEVTQTPWVVAGQQAVQFSVRGLSHTTDEVTAHRAEIYTFAISQDRWMIWLEVRQVSKATGLDISDRSLLKASGREMAEELVKEVLALWSVTPDAGEIPAPVQQSPLIPAPATPTITPVVPVAPGVPVLPPPAATASTSSVTTSAPIAPPSSPATPTTTTPPPAPAAAVKTPETTPAPAVPVPVTPTVNPPAAVIKTSDTLPAAPATPASVTPAANPPAAPAVPTAIVKTPETTPAAAVPVPVIPTINPPAVPAAVVKTPDTTPAPATPASVTPAANPPATPAAAVKTPDTTPAPATPVSVTPAANPPATPAAVVKTPDAPPASTAPATPAPAANVPVIPATPTSVAPASNTPDHATATATTPAANPPGAQTPASPAPATPSSAAPAPATPSGQRWQTEDGGLTFFLPDGWSVSGKDPNPALFTGLSGVTMRLYPAETYATASELTNALHDFVDSQKEISAGHFSQQDFSVSGASGVLVQYTNYTKHMTLAYFFGKSGHLWRFEVELGSENATIPASIPALMANIQVK